MTKPSIPRTCEHCGSGFLAQPAQVKTGYGKFCSHRCAGRPKPRVERICGTCGNVFYVNLTPWKIKTGRVGKFCSRACVPREVLATRKPQDLSERFWRCVKRGAGCWLWIGPIQGAGYGRLMTPSGGRLAHRISYELHYGPFPKQLCVCHHCDTPLCVRPDHLFLGTRFINNLDCALKGRRVQKLSIEKVREIRILYAHGGITQKQLGEQYGVGWRTIGQVVRREIWQHVE